MNLVIDIGNTFMKLFVFEENNLLHFNQCKTTNQDKIAIYLDEYQKISNSIISSVSDISDSLLAIVNGFCQKVIILDHQTPVPVKNLYKTPESLGLDRLAGIVGAYNIYKQQNVLAIDAGTALTFDFINKKGEYTGGNISPGLYMRYNALNYFTKKLPLLEVQESFPFWGSSTHEAIVAGVQNGIIFEIDGLY